jgi:hypothetical protein
LPTTGCTGATSWASPRCSLAPLTPGYREATWRRVLAFHPAAETRGSRYVQVTLAAEHEQVSSVAGLT